MAPAQLKSGLEQNLFDIMRLADFSLLLFSAILAYYLRHDNLVISAAYAYVTGLGIVSFLVFAQMMDIYKYRHLHSLRPQVLRLIAAHSCAILVCVLLLFMMKISGDFSRLWMGYWFILNIIGGIIIHALFLNWFKKQLLQGRFIRKIVLVGQTKRAQDLLKQINDPHRTNVSALAVYSPQNVPKEKDLNLPVLTSLDELIQCVRDEEVDDVIVTASLEDEEISEKLLEDLRNIPCHVRYCLAKPLFNKGQANHVWGAPIISIYRRPLEGRDLRLKRLFDLTAASAAILILSPVLLGIAAALRLSGQKDIFFAQERHGLAGMSFNVLKFRSMRVADKGTGDVKQATKNDPRVTKIGAVLRKTSLDELPQLFNVLRGDMSLVGPRPHAISHNDHYAKLVTSYMARNRMKPGITGWAQVNGWRGETDTLEKMEKRVEFDLYYVENWSLWLDIKILIMTPLTLFSKNAY